MQAHFQVAVRARRVALARAIFEFDEPRLVAWQPPGILQAVIHQFEAHLAAEVDEGRLQLGGHLSAAGDENE